MMKSLNEWILNSFHMTGHPSKFHCEQCYGYKVVHTLRRATPWCFHSSATWFCVSWSMDSNIVSQHNVLIHKCWITKNSCWMFDPCRWGHYAASKHWDMIAHWRSVMSQKNRILSNTAVNAQNKYGWTFLHENKPECPYSGWLQSEPSTWGERDNCLPNFNVRLTSLKYMKQ